MKLALYAPILVPLRIGAILCVLTVAIVSANLAVLGADKKKLTESPMSWWRRALRLPAVYASRALLWCLGILWIERKGTGKCAPPSEAQLVLANHIGFLETFIMGYESGGMPVSRMENASMPLFGPMVGCMQPIYVDRNDPNSRQYVKGELVRRTTPKKGESWPQVLIFPEGTCANQQALVCFKTGAFIPGRPVQPVAIRFPVGMVDPCWVCAGPDIGELMLRLMAQPYQPCELIYLPVYHPSDEEKKDARLFANNVRDVIAAALGVPCTDHSFDDVKLQLAATKLRSKRVKEKDRKSHLTVSAGGIQMRKLKEVAPH